MPHSLSLNCPASLKCSGGCCSIASMETRFNCLPLKCNVCLYVLFCPLPQAAKCPGTALHQGKSTPHFLYWNIPPSPKYLLSQGLALATQMVEYPLQHPTSCNYISLSYQKRFSLHTERQVSTASVHDHFPQVALANPGYFCG